MYIEAGIPCFPYDFPGTTSYSQWSAETANHAEKRHNQLPPAKRPNYERLGVDRPFDAPFASFATCSPAELCNEHTCLIVRRSAVCRLLQMLASRVDVVTVTDVASMQSPSWHIPSDSAPSKGSCISLVRVRLVMDGRGVVGRNAVIYTLDDDMLMEKHKTRTLEQKLQSGHSEVSHSSIILLGH